MWTIWSQLLFAPFSPKIQLSMALSRQEVFDRVNSRDFGFMKLRNFNSFVNRCTQYKSPDIQHFISFRSAQTSHFLICMVDYRCEDPSIIWYDELNDCSLFTTAYRLVGYVLLYLGINATLWSFHKLSFNVARAKKVHFTCWPVI